MCAARDERGAGPERLPLATVGCQRMPRIASTTGIGLPKWQLASRARNQAK